MTGISQSVLNHCRVAAGAAMRLEIQTQDGKKEYTKYVVTTKCDRSVVGPAFNYTAKSTIYRVRAQALLIYQGPILDVIYNGNYQYR